MPVPRIEASLTAAHLMTQIPGLRNRVEEALSGVVETAVELRRVHGFEQIGSAASPLRLEIGNYTIWYYLDAADVTAKVVYIEMKSREGLAPPDAAPQREPDNVRAIATEPGPSSDGSSEVA